MERGAALPLAGPTEAAVGAALGLDVDDLLAHGATGAWPSKMSQSSDSRPRSPRRNRWNEQWCVRCAAIRTLVAERPPLSHPGDGCGNGGAEDGDDGDGDSAGAAAAAGETAAGVIVVVVEAAACDAALECDVDVVGCDADGEVLLRGTVRASDGGEIGDSCDAAATVSGDDTVGSRDAVRAPRNSSFSPALSVAAGGTAPAGPRQSKSM